MDPRVLSSSRFIVKQRPRPAMRWLELTGGCGAERAVRYGHMATVARMVEQRPFRWIAGWQAARSIEGTDGQHLRVAFSDDGRKWTQSYPLPVGRNQVGQRTHVVIRSLTNTCTASLRPPVGSLATGPSTLGHR
jgi:hypothetical protein